MTAQPSRPNIETLARGAIRTITYNWAGPAASLGSSVSSATVTADPTGITLGSVTVSANVLSVSATVPDYEPIGCHHLKWSVTFANGEKEVRSTPLDIVEHKNGA